MDPEKRRIRVGCAGWTIPKRHAASFPAEGSHLERYAQRFSAVEINTSFRRPHRRGTYGRWAAQVPAGFAFAVKAPMEITHQHRLSGDDALLDAFLGQVVGLGDKLGPLLFQMPPSLALDPPAAGLFFAALRDRFDGDVVCEPRHPDWFTAAAEDLFKAFRISRVAAHPPVAGAAAEPGGWDGVAYFRLHGSPYVYYSEYSLDQLERLTRQLARSARRNRRTWCVFDNTAAGAATANALALEELIGRRRPKS